VKLQFRSSPRKAGLCSAGSASNSEKQQPLPPEQNLH
jgi:hypothetical protein